MNTVINLKKKTAQLNEYWSPRILGEVDDSYAKIAKLKGSLTWHKHDDEDEFFLVFEGELKIEMKDKTVELSSGDMYVVPKGVMHNPIAQEECSVFLIEKKSTKHTGDKETEKTRTLAEQLRPI